MTQVRRKKRQPISELEIKGAVAWISEKHPQNDPQLLALLGMEDIERVKDLFAITWDESNEYPRIGWSLVNQYWTTSNHEANVVAAPPVTTIDAVGISGDVGDGERILVRMQEWLQMQMTSLSDQRVDDVMRGVRAELKKERDATTWWRTLAKRDGVCRECDEQSIREGQPYLYQHASGVAYCIPCGMKLHIPYRDSSRLKELDT